MPFVLITQSKLLETSLFQSDNPDSKLSTWGKTLTEFKHELGESGLVAGFDQTPPKGLALIIVSTRPPQTLGSSH